MGLSKPKTDVAEKRAMTLKSEVALLAAREAEAEQRKTFTFSLTVDMHHRFKSDCSLKGLKMGAVLEALIKQHLDGQ